MPDSGYPSPQELALGLIARHDYQPLSFAFGWRAYGDGWADPGLWQDPFGIVHLRGRVFSDIARVGGEIFAFPGVASPASTETFLVTGSAAAAAISADENALIFAGPAGPAGLWFDISGITYPSEF